MQNYKTLKFINEMKSKFPKIDFSQCNYINSKTPIKLYCTEKDSNGNEHGWFEQKPEYMRHYNRCCDKCRAKENSSKFIDTEECIRRCKLKFPDYDYSKVIYKSMRDRIIVTCNICGREFYPLPQNIIRGHGCDYCGKEKSIVSRQDTTKDYINKCKKVWGDLYDYSKTIFTGPENEVIITCKKHGDFKKIARNHINSKQGCPKCSQERLSILQTSKGEQEILEFIKSIYSGKILTNTKDILYNKQELDIYIPDKKIAIEFDGIYYHSEIKKDNNYHLNKTILCEQNDIQLIHIFETEWYEKQNIIKSRIQQLLGLTKYKIPARKCIIKPISNETEKKFFNNNHLQGYTNSTICYGLFYTEKSNNKEYLVACMSFGPLRKNLGQSNKSKCYELYRFANLKNFTVIGGASKLFKYFINKFKPNEIISYADRRYSSQLRKTLYENLGFKFVSNTQPSYFYIVNNKLINRFNFRKDILVSKYGCPPEKTEHQFCLEQGWYRIYDCGNLKYVWLSEITK